MRIARHELGRDAFHRVRFFASQVSDAVERVPTQWFMGSKRENLFRRNLSPSDGEG